MAIPRDGYRKGLRKFYDWIETVIGGDPGTPAQLETGTDEVPRTWSAKDVHDEIARQIAEGAGG